MTKRPARAHSDLSMITYEARPTHTVCLVNSDLQSHSGRLIYKELMKYQNNTKENNNILYKIAISTLVKKIELKDKAKLTHLNDLFRLSSYVWADCPGLPWSEIGYQTKADIRDDPDAVNDVRRFWHFVKLSYYADNKNMKFPHCTVGYGPKNSGLLWQYPATVNFGEAVYTTKLIKAFSQQDGAALMAYDYKADTEGFKRIYNRFHRDNKYYVKLCFNENTVPAWLILKAFDMLVLQIDFKHYDDYGIPDARFMIHMFCVIRNYFISTPIRLANDTLIVKGCGLPGGSHFTELIGSLISAFIIHYLSLNIDKIHPEDLVVLGTESLARIPTYWDLNECQNIIEKDFGMTLNLSKCQVSRNLKQIHFLGYKRIWMQ